MMNYINSKQTIQPLEATESPRREKGRTVTSTPEHKTGRTPFFSYRLCKEICDRIFAFICMIILLPLMALIAILIRLDSRGNPIFVQERVGKDERRFPFYKFRSMYLDHDDSEYYEVIEKYVREDIITPPITNGGDNKQYTGDPRVTRVGRLLRKTNLDELPQLFNILKGDMSFVGPRPMIPYIVDMYSDHHKKSFEVKPGLTGLWQASGRKALSFEDMIRLDIDYIEKQSLLLDIKIIVLTVLTILRGEGS